MKNIDGSSPSQDPDPDLEHDFFMEHIVGDDYFMLYLDTYLKDTFAI